MDLIGPILAPSLPHLAMNQSLGLSSRSPFSCPRNNWMPLGGSFCWMVKMCVYIYLWISNKSIFIAILVYTSCFSLFIFHLKTPSTLKMLTFSILQYTWHLFCLSSRAMKSYHPTECCPEDELGGCLVENYRPPCPLFDRVVRSYKDKMEEE